MDRADVIIFGGGMVGLALASALEFERRCRRSSSIPPTPRRAATRRSTAAPARSRRARCGCCETIGVADHLAEPGCPIRRIAVADGLQPGGLHFDADDDEPLGWMHENRHLRAALQRARRGRQESVADVEVARDRASIAATTASSSRSMTAASFTRRCWSPPTAAIRRPARPPGSRSRAGNTIIRRSCRCSATSAPHDHVAYEIFYPSGPFALLPMTDDAGGHRSAIVWSVPNDDATGWLALE